MTEALIWLAVLALLVVGFRSIVNRRPHVGAASAGTIYDWLNQDKRKAIEIVVDGQAERQDGERAQDNPPELEHPDLNPASNKRGDDACRTAPLSGQDAAADRRAPRRHARGSAATCGTRDSPHS